MFIRFNSLLSFSTWACSPASYAASFEYYRQPLLSPIFNKARTVLAACRPSSRTERSQIFYSPPRNLSATHVYSSLVSSPLLTTFSTLLFLRISLFHRVAPMAPSKFFVQSSKKYIQSHYELDPLSLFSVNRSPIVSYLWLFFTDSSTKHFSL